MDLDFFHRFGDDNPAFGCWGKQAIGWRCTRVIPTLGFVAWQKRVNTWYWCWTSPPPTRCEDWQQPQDFDAGQKLLAPNPPQKNCSAGMDQGGLNSTEEMWGSTAAMWATPYPRGLFTRARLSAKDETVMTNYYKMQTVVLHKKWILERFGHRRLLLRLTLRRMNPWDLCDTH